MSRDGNALQFTFEDGAAIRLDDFYTNYTIDNLPEFDIAGELVSGTNFFTAFGPDIAPVAALSVSDRTARAAPDHVTSDLAAGVDHLEGTDLTINGSEPQYGSLQFNSPGLLRAGNGVGNPGDGGGGGGALLPFWPLCASRTVFIRKPGRACHH